MKSDYDFTRYRTVLGFQRSKRYLEFMKARFPYCDLHHCLGSTMGRKFTDYFIVPIDHRHHLEVVEPHKGFWFSQYFEASLNHLIWYARQELNMSFVEIAKLLPNYEPENVKTFIEAVYQKENE